MEDSKELINDATALELLEEMLEIMVKGNSVMSARFMADHEDHLELLKKLEQYRFIEQKDRNYQLRMISIIGMAESSKTAETILRHCEVIFELLRAHYKEHLDKTISLNEVGENLALNREDVNVAAGFLKDAPIFGCTTTGFPEQEDAEMGAGSSILEYKTFQALVDQLKFWHKPRKEQSVTYPILEERLGWPQQIGFEHLLHERIAAVSMPHYRNGNIRGAVLDSLTAVFDIIREKTGLRIDGDRLVNQAFSMDDPFIVLSELNTESGQNDQKGFMQIFRGAYQGIRNPKAHTLDHDLDEHKAAQYLILSSLLARRLDEAHVVKQAS